MSEQAPAPSRPAPPDGPYLVVGLARSGMAAASALRRRGASVVGVDSGSPEGARRLEEEGVEVRLRSDGLELLGGIETVVKSPGVPDRAPVVEGARARGVTVIGELELAWRMLANDTIAVTGTNGKTTTVQLVAEIHRQAGIPVAAAGNVGLALSALVGRVDSSVRIVCEASSFQLADTIAFRPDAAALLNLAPDHLDRHGTFEAYVESKLQAFARQRPEDVAVLPLEQEATPQGPIQGETLAGRIQSLGGRAQIVRFGRGADARARLHDGALWWEGDRLLPVAELRIRGAHNALNALAAAAVCLARGIEIDAVRAGLRSFAGVEHRLEEARTVGGVVYVNDSKATNIASTTVALAAMGEGGGRERTRVHLILGGQGKGQDFRELRRPVREACAAVYLIGEEEAGIADALAGLDVPVERCGDLESALRRATVAARRDIAARRWVSAARAGGGAGAAEAPPAEMVLLSPGCASFDQFDDYEARGRRFKQLVGEL